MFRSGMGRRKKIADAYRSLSEPEQLRKGALATDIEELIPGGDFAKYASLSNDAQRRVDGLLTTLLLSIGVDAPGGMIVEVVANEYRKKI